MPPKEATTAKATPAADTPTQPTDAATTPPAPPAATTTPPKAEPALEPLGDIFREEAPPAVVTFGNPGAWKLIQRVEHGPCAVVTEALPIQGVGCLVKVSHEIHGQGIPALHFVPNVRVQEETDQGGAVVARHLVAGH